MESVKEFFNNLGKKFRRVFTDKGIVVAGYRVSYRIIPIIIAALLILILFFSLLGRLFRGGKSGDTPTPGDTQTQAETVTEGTEGTSQEETTEQQPQEDPGNPENDGENYYAVKNGTKVVGLFETEAEAKALLTSLKAEFVDVNDRSALVTLEPELTIEKVAQTEDAKKDLVKDSRALVNELLYGSSEESTYVATADDTMWGIAVANDISLEELLAANPDIDPDNLHAGDVIKIKVGQGEISVKAVYEEVKEVDIPYETVYEDSDELYVGEEEVVTWGRKGRKVVTTKIVKVNGVTISSDESEEEILEEAVTELIKRGTIGKEDDSTDDEEKTDDEASESSDDSGGDSSNDDSTGGTGDGGEDSTEDSTEGTTEGE